HTRFDCDWSSDVCSSDLFFYGLQPFKHFEYARMVFLLNTDSVVVDADPNTTSKWFSVDVNDRPYSGRDELHRVADQVAKHLYEQIGRASCRERGEQRGV